MNVRRRRKVKPRDLVIGGVLYALLGGSALLTGFALLDLLR